MNLQLIVFLFVYLLLLILIRSLERLLAREKSDHDVALAVGEALQRRIIELEVKYDRLLGEKVNDEERRVSPLIKQLQAINSLVDETIGVGGSGAHFPTALEGVRAMRDKFQSELKRKHRKFVF